MSGLDQNGFEKKTLTEIKLEIEDHLRSVFGAFINLLPGSVFATIIGIFAERESLIWDLIEEVYNAMYPTTAEGANLDNAVGFNGITRLGAAKSRVLNFLLFGDDLSTIAAGTQFSVDGNSQAIFQTENTVTLGAGRNDIQRISFSEVPTSGTFSISHLGQTTSPLDKDATAQDVEDALNALSLIDEVEVSGDYATGFVIEFTGNDGLQPMANVTVQSSLAGVSAVDVSVSKEQQGEAQAVVNLVALEDGPVDAPIRTLTVIETPVAGLTRGLNLSATVLGRFVETDSELRVRRRNTLTIAGNATPEAIRSRLSNLPGVLNVFIFENETLVTDLAGRPGKSYEAVVSGGIEADIAKAIWDSKPAGIQTWGNISEQVVDSTGTNRLIRFSRPNDLPIYVSIDLFTDPAQFPANGAGLAQQAIIDWGNRIGIGNSIIVYPQLVAQLNFIPGILDMIIRIDTDPVSTTPEDPALDDNIIVPPDSVAEFSNLNVDINIL